jgi:hypothetical protein
MRHEREGLGRRPAFSYMNVCKPGLALLMCFAVLGLAAAHANAAAYHAYLCKVPYGPNAGKPAPADNLVPTLNAGTATTNCTEPGGSMQALLDGAAHVNRQGALWSFAAPSGLTISAFTLWRHVAVGPAGSGAAPETQLAMANGAVVVDECSQPIVNPPCVSLGNPATPLADGNKVTRSGLSGVTNISWAARCGAPGSTPAGTATCPATAPAPSAIYQVFAADMVLDDPTPPAVSGAPSGPLLAGGTLTGAQSVSVGASDVGSGVYKGSLSVDGAVVTESVLDDVGGACADLGGSPDGLPSYLGAHPCPASVNGLLTVDTDRLSPGGHELTVRVGDAAGNQTVARTATIRVVGPRPTGTPNGSGASRFAKLTAQFAGRRAARVRRFGFRTLPVITGRLVDERGNPIGAAAVDVLVRDRRAGAERQRIATATTGGDGTFRVQLPSGPSRTITLQYTPFTGDPKPSTTATLSARVRGRISAALHPRVLSLGGRIALSGRLGYLRRRGVTVVIQVRNGRMWQTYGVPKTDSEGRYRWTYRFKTRGSAGKTFAFRAKVDSPLYPFTSTTSRPVYVSVR